MSFSLDSAASPLFRERRAGVLLHPTSLPPADGHNRDDGNGALGAAAHRFLDFLAEAGFSLWQMLPIGPTHADRSPYQLLSAHAGNTELICLQGLCENGWLDETAARELPRRNALQAAARRFFQASGGDVELGARYASFRRAEAGWLDDFALFIALREQRGDAPWWLWPQPLRRRDPGALAAAASALRERMDGVCFEQFVFFEQWQALRARAKARGIHLFGDMPIFVSHDSADVWTHQNLFQLDENGCPRVVAGVPPDYFSATGQRWGNPLYDWDAMRARGFDWWLRRLRGQLDYFDLIRIDHFRGFEALWEIPAGAATAVQGRWVAAPGEALLDAFFRHDPQLPLVAENLGVITEEVEALRRRFSLPGMLILQFAFDGSPHNPYLPHRHDPLEVVYTGTHDNDTTVGWYRTLDDATRARVDAYLGHSSEAMPWPLIRAALASVARLAVLPMQDLLELDGGARMNVPGTSAGNWRWRVDVSKLTPELAGRLREQLSLYGRVP